MADYRLRWTNGNDQVEVDLVDDIGPSNSYTFSDPNAVVPSAGSCTNQMQQVVPAGGGWVIRNFDNGKDYVPDDQVNSAGDGNVDITNVGTFPKGDFQWLVIKRL